MSETRRDTVQRATRFACARGSSYSLAHWYTYNAMLSQMLQFAIQLNERRLMIWPSTNSQIQLGRSRSQRSQEFGRSHTTNSAHGEPHEAHQQKARLEADKLRESLAIAIDQNSDDEE